MLIEDRLKTHMARLREEDRRRDSRCMPYADDELLKDALETLGKLRTKAEITDRLDLENVKLRAEGQTMRQALQSVVNLPEPHEGEDIGIIAARFRVARQIAHAGIPNPLRGKVIEDVVVEKGGIRITFQDGTSAKMTVKDRAIGTEITNRP